MTVVWFWEEAEKTYKLVEKRFLANDNARALWSTRKAQRLLHSSSPAATSSSNSRNWYTVLDVGGRLLMSGNVTHNAVKQGYRQLYLFKLPRRRGRRSPFATL